MSKGGEGRRAERSSRLPRRSRQYGVGKEIGGAVYLHRDYADLLGEHVVAARRLLPEGFSYTVIKYNRQRRDVSFIQSPDFDTNPEPTVGRSCLIKPDGKIRFCEPPADPFIYHHKWLMVDDDYPGFDVEESKRRSAAWSALPGVDRLRIGRRHYWEQTAITNLSLVAGDAE